MSFGLRAVSTFAEAIATYDHEVRPVPAAAAFAVGTASTYIGGASAIMPVPADALTGRSVAPTALATIIADAASGVAMRSAGNKFSNATLSMHVDAVDEFPRAGHLHCLTEVVSSIGRDRHLVQGVVTDDTDRPVATCTSWWLAGDRHAPPTDEELSSPDPVATEPGSTLDARFGIEELASSGGTTTVRATRVRRYLNRRNALHGGVSALLCELAVERALARAGHDLPATLSSAVTYYARTGVDAAPVDIEATVVWARERFATVHTRILTASGDDAVRASFFRGQALTPRGSHGR